MQCLAAVHLQSDLITRLIILALTIIAMPAADASDDPFIMVNN